MNKRNIKKMRYVYIRNKIFRHSNNDCNHTNLRWIIQISIRNSTKKKQKLFVLDYIFVYAVSLKKFYYKNFFIPCNIQRYKKLPCKKRLARFICIALKEGA